IDSASTGPSNPRISTSGGRPIEDRSNARCRTVRLTAQPPFHEVTPELPHRRRFRHRRVADNLRLQIELGNKVAAESPEHRSGGENQEQTGRPNVEVGKLL